MLINLKVKTLDARTHDFSIDNELTIRQFKDQIAVKTNIAAENQRIIYQGRVLADDKQVKEYDVDGKVLHVAERPPFSQRGANATNNDEPSRDFRSVTGRPTTRNMRNSPYFRALDGMLVGTMAIPVNNGNLTAAGTRTPPNRFPNSSSFCINRITVAQHMIDCANNIAAYLENPEIGLNNQPLDILQRGHWTMESTVVEVGVSTDMPRNNNIIDMVQDAVSAALSRNTPGRNYTVVQLPTVYTNEPGGAENSQQQPQSSNDAGNEASNDEGGAASAGTASNSESSDDATAAAAAVIIEDVIVTDDDERSTSPQSGEDTNAAEAGGAAGASGSAAPAAAGSGDDSNTPTVNVTGVDSRRRTRPQVLAAVIQRYRTVETRLAPFLDRYHEILQQDPEFGEQDNAARENAQRTFDRVSEAMHYLSHAQHAISDLMLDMSQPGPRVLTCRPILVEQSGYIRSNNIFTPNNFAAPFTELLPQMPAPTAAAATNAESGQAASSSLSARAARAQAEAGANEMNINHLLARLETDRDRVIREVVLGPAPDEPQPTQAAERGQAPNASHDDDLLEEIVEDERMLEDVAAIVAGLGQHRTENVEDPVDEPMVAPPTAPQSQDQQQQQPQAPQQPNEHTEQSVESTGAEAEAEAPRPRFRLYVPVPLPPPNPYMRIARLIQAVANSATNEADLRLEFNMPNVINLPVHVITAALHPQAEAATGTSSAATAAAAASSDTTTAAAAAAAGAAPATATVLGNASAAASTSSGTRSGDQRANTLPTTATQTRSTSRPQIQIGGNNNWAGRIAPTHTAFDRFLPCNSHHIREVEQPLVQQQQQQQQQPQQPATTTQTNNNNNNNRSSSGSSNSHNLRATIHPIVVPRRGGASNGPNYAVVIANRMRNQMGANVSRPLLGRRAAYQRGESSRTGASANNMPAVATATAAVGGAVNVNRTPLTRPMHRTGRLLNPRFHNYMVTNMRNHRAQTGGLGGNTAATEAARVAVATSADAILNARAARTSIEAGISSAPAIVAGATVTDNNTTAAAATSSSSTSGSQASRNLRAQVRNFLHHTVFEGEPINALTIPTAIDRALDWFADSLLYLRQYERPEYNSHDSVCNMLRLSLRLIIALCNDPSHCHVHFEHRLKQICEQFRMRLYSVLFLCLGSANAELFWRQLMRLLCVPLRSNFRNEALQFLCIYIDPTIPAHTDTADAQQFLVLRNAAQTTQPTDDDQQQQQQPQEQQPEQQSLDNDIEMAEVASSSNSSSAIEMEPALPAVTAGSEPWHTSFPNDWLPVITRDLQTQTEQTRAQPPYSDAYISGMSAKRRKIIQTEKPPTNVECLIASGVQRAIHRAGLSGGTASNPAVNTDAVINAIAHDAVVQTSYTDAVRTNARDRIKHDIDYKSSKYPQIAKFTEQK